MTRVIIVQVKGSKPTKKNPKAPKVTAKEALAKFLTDFANDMSTNDTVVAILPAGFGGYDVIIQQEE